MEGGLFVSALKVLFFDQRFSATLEQRYYQVGVVLKKDKRFHLLHITFTALLEGDRVQKGHRFQSIAADCDARESVDWSYAVDKIRLLEVDFEIISYDSRSLLYSTDVSA